MSKPKLPKFKTKLERLQYLKKVRIPVMDINLAIMVEEARHARRKGFLEVLLLHKKYNPTDPNIDEAIAYEKAKIAKKNKLKNAIKNTRKENEK